MVQVANGSFSEEGADRHIPDAEHAIRQLCPIVIVTNTELRM